MLVRFATRGPCFPSLLPFWAATSVQARRTFIRGLMRFGLIVAAFAGLGIVALTGWTRHVSASPTGLPTCVEPASVQQPSSVQQSYAPPPVYATMPYGSSIPAGADANEEAMPDAGPAYPAAQSDRQAPAIRRKYRYVRTPAKVYYRRARHKRPFSHSVAIVGGSAAAGAGIGALAGGGRGAGIGALAGGAGGLIYDRVTHNR
jgi:hypothetical protein